MTGCLPPWLQGPNQDVWDGEEGIWCLFSSESGLPGLAGRVTASGSFSWSECTYLEGAARTGTEPPILRGMQAEATQKHLGELQLSQ